MNSVKRNVFGELEYSITYNGARYFVSCRPDYDGKYTINKYDPSSSVIVRAAQIPSELLSVVYPDMFWENAPRFDTWVKAINYLKNNVKNML